MAFDRAGVKARLAAALLAERARRGGGDARRFPQPEMARVLGYSLRQYQRLEDPDDANLPTWNNIEVIAEKLGLDTAAIFGDPAAIDAADADAPDSTALMREVADLRERLGRIEELLTERLPSPDTSRSSRSRRPSSAPR